MPRMDNKELESRNADKLSNRKFKKCMFLTNVDKYPMQNLIFPQFFCMGLNPRRYEFARSDNFEQIIKSRKTSYLRHISTGRRYEFLRLIMERKRLEQKKMGQCSWLKNVNAWTRLNSRHH